MTNQEIFTKVKNHLLQQKRRSVNKKGRCVYRGENGLKCAIGCLIPDELYDPDFDNSGLKTINLFCKLGFYISENYDLLYSLRVVHDYEKIEEWEDCLKNTAFNFNLEY